MKTLELFTGLGTQTNKNKQEACRDKSLYGMVIKNCKDISNTKILTFPISARLFDFRTLKGKKIDLVEKSVTDFINKIDSEISNMSSNDLVIHFTTHKGPNQLTLYDSDVIVYYNDKVPVMLLNDLYNLGLKNEKIITATISKEYEHINDGIVHILSDEKPFSIGISIIKYRDTTEMKSLVENIIETIKWYL